MSNNRNMIIAAIVVVGAGIGYFALKSKTPVPSGTEGTIGAAQRYSEPQIAEGDVSLQDPEIQAFLQSDVFHKMQTNPEFRELVTSPEFGQLVADGALAKVVGELAFQQLSKSSAFKLLARESDFATLASHSEFWTVTSKAEIGKLSTTSRQALARLLAEEDFAKLLEDPEFEKMMADALSNKVETATDYNMMMSRAGVDIASQGAKATTASVPSRTPARYPVQAVRELQKYSGDAGFKTLFTDLNFQALATPELGRVAGLLAFRNLVKAGLLKVAATDAFAQMARNAAFVTMSQSTDFSKVMELQAFNQLVTQSDFQNFVKAPEASKIAGMSTADLEHQARGVAADIGGKKTPGDPKVRKNPLEIVFKEPLKEEVR